MLDAYFTIRMSSAQVRAIDEYRRKRPNDVCSRAMAIRELVWAGIIASRTDKLPEDDEHEHGTAS